MFRGSQHEDQSFRPLACRDRGGSYFLSKLRFSESDMLIKTVLIESTATAARRRYDSRSRTVAAVSPLAKWSR